MEVRSEVFVFEGSHDRARAICGEALDPCGDGRRRLLADAVLDVESDRRRREPETPVMRWRMPWRPDDMARAFGDDHQLLMASHVLVGVPGASEDPRASGGRS